MLLSLVVVLCAVILLLLRNHPVSRRLALRVADYRAAASAAAPCSALPTPTAACRQGYRGLRVDTSDADVEGTPTHVVQISACGLRDRECCGPSAPQLLPPPPPPPRSSRAAAAVAQRFEVPSPPPQAAAAAAAAPASVPRFPSWYEALSAELRRLQHMQRLNDEARVGSIASLAAIEAEAAQLGGAGGAGGGRDASTTGYLERVEEYKTELVRQASEQLLTTISLQQQQQDILSKMTTSPRNPVGAAAAAACPPPRTCLAPRRPTSGAATPCSTPSDADLALPPLSLCTPHATPQGTPQLAPSRVPAAATAAAAAATSAPRRPPSRTNTPRGRRGSLGQGWKKGGLIGTGAFGTVHAAMDDEGRMMAVKNIPFNVHEASEKRAGRLSALKNEIDTMRCLEHPNIVRYIGAERDGDSLNIFMEFVSGGSIASLIKTYGALTESVVVSYTCQLLEGLHYLHSRGVIHRDIKGANALLTVGGVCKLADFGAATFVQDGDLHKSLVGTPNWMSPEVIRQKGHTQRADTWSLGCTVMEMLTARPPWAHVCSSPMMALNYIVGDDSIDDVCRQAVDGLCSDAGVSFILSCVRREPSERLSTDALREHAWLAPVADDDGRCAAEGEDEDGGWNEATQWKHAVRETNAKLKQSLGAAADSAVPRLAEDDEEEEDEAEVAAAARSGSPEAHQQRASSLPRPPGFRKSVSVERAAFSSTLPQQQKVASPNFFGMPTRTFTHTHTHAPHFRTDDVTVSPLSPGRTSHSPPQLVIPVGTPASVHGSSLSTPLSPDAMRRLDAFG